MSQLTISTKNHNQVINLTDKLNSLVSQTRVDEGVCVVTAQHTTCCITTADLDPGTDQDLLDAINNIFPEGDYRHPHDPSHVDEHIMSSLIGPDVSIPIENGQLKLGTWQNVVLVELSGPRQRTISVNVLQT